MGPSIPPWPGWCFTLWLIPIPRSREDFRRNRLSIGLVWFGSQLEEIEDQTKVGAEAGLTPLLDLLPAADRESARVCTGPKGARPPAPKSYDHSRTTKVP